MISAGFYIIKRIPIMNLGNAQIPKPRAAKVQPTEIGHHSPPAGTFGVLVVGFSVEGLGFRV